MNTKTRVLCSLAVAAAVAAGPTVANAADPDPFTGDRKVTLSPQDHEFALTVSKDGSISSTERWGKRSMVVPVPLGGDRYWLQTAHLRRGGEPLCLKLTKKAVVTDACDSSARHQRFAFTDAGDTEGGDPTYTIRTGGNRYLVVTDGARFAPAQIGEGTPDIDTPFLLVDRGRASLPALD
jgi:hypothetical protein